MIELMFKREMVISLSSTSISELGDKVRCVGEDAGDPSVAARCRESEDEIMLVRLRRRGSGCQQCDAKHKATVQRCERNEDG